MSFYRASSHLLATLLLLTSTTHALEINFGKGDFQWEVGITGVYRTDVTLDIDLLKINEQHFTLNHSPYYLFGNLDIYSSKKVDQLTDIVDSIMLQSLPITPLPSLFGIETDSLNAILGNLVPVPSSYKISGVDFDIGVGYDLLTSPKGYLGAGLMTGISMPFMRMENPLEAMEFIDDLLTKTHTDIKTYKAGVTLQAGYQATPELTLYTTLLYAYQTGSIKNSIIKSSMDVDGSYRAIDIGMTFAPKHTYIPKKLYFNAGYSKKQWTMDSVEVEIIGVNLPGISSFLSNAFESDYLYLGVGYHF